MNQDLWVAKSGFGVHLTKSQKDTVVVRFRSTWEGVSRYAIPIFYKKGSLILYSENVTPPSECVVRVDQNFDSVNH